MKHLKSRLQSRVLLLSIAGILALVGVLWWAAVVSLRESAAQTAEQERILAGLIAGTLENRLSETLDRLQKASFAKEIDLKDNNWDPEQRALHQAFLDSGCSTLMLLNTEGTVLLTDPDRPQLHNKRLAEFPEVQKAIQSKKPTITNVFGPDQTILLLVPIHHDFLFKGFMAGEWNRNLFFSNQARWFFSNQARWKNSIIPIRVLDGNGSLLMSIAWDTGSEDKTEISVPLEKAPLTVHIRVPDSTAPWKMMQKRFLMAGAFFLILSLGFSWAVASSITRPVRKLMECASQIASGHFEEPVPVSGEDEIGTLGQQLEIMRQQVAESNRILEQKVEDRTRKVRDLLRKIISTQEEERKRIARELHDEMSQTLTALLINLESLPNEGLKTYKSHILQAIDSIHNLIFDLRPAVLDDLGLASAIRWYSDQRLKPAGIKVHFEGEFPDETRLPFDVEIALFRIAQEAMTNILRHSGAEEVFITLDYPPGLVILEIEDDGVGFSLSEIKPEKNHFGLLGIQERAQLLGGTVTLESTPGSGARIVVSIPLTEEEVPYG